MKFLTVFGMSMVPVIELRGAVPYGVALGLDLRAVLAVSIIGNMVPVPFIILFIRKILDWMKKRSKFLSDIASKLENKAEKKKALIDKYAIFGLIILVAIPFPGTGAWTGSLVAAIFDMPIKKAVPAVFVGVVIAGLIMSILSYGVSMLVG